MGERQEIEGKEVREALYPCDGECKCMGCRDGVRAHRSDISCGRNWETKSGGSGEKISNLSCIPIPTSIRRLSKDLSLTEIHLFSRLTVD